MSETAPPPPGEVAAAAQSVDVPAPAEAAAAAAAAVEQPAAAAGAAAGAADPAPADPRDGGRRILSEEFKVKIVNFPKHFYPPDLKKLMKKLGLNPIKTKKGPKWNYGFVSFRNEEDREEALQKLRGYKIKQNVLDAQKEKALTDAMLKRKRVDGEDGDSSKAARYTPATEDMLNSGVPLEEQLADRVTPLWRKPYETQLALKHDEMCDALRELGERIAGEAPSAEWQKKNREANDGLIVPLPPVVPSPTVDGYRNKYEFTIGRSLDGSVDCMLGFKLGSYSGGIVAVAEPTMCLNVSDVADKLRIEFQRYVQQVSPYPSFDPVTHQGNWRQILVRTPRTGQNMIQASFHPQTLSETELEEEMERMRLHFRPLVEAGQIASLLILFNDAGSVRHPLSRKEIVLLGEKTITEQLLGLTYRISSSSFFQVNTTATEVLLERLRGFCGATEEARQKTTLLDVCCGTGIIGLSLAQSVRQVIGLEIVPEAIQDAEHNAALNGITNKVYVAGPAESTIDKMVAQIPEDNDVIAILDPPRAGAHKKVLGCIRNCKSLNKLIYVSCNVRLAMPNFIDLCRPSSARMPGKPFRLEQALAVDLFPHTKLCELILIFTRDE